MFHVQHGKYTNCNDNCLILDIGLKINNIFFNYLEPIISPIQNVINTYMDMSSVFIIVNQVKFFK